MKKIILFILAILLTACSATAASDYDRNLSKWEDTQPAHYRYDLFIGCFCPFMEDMPLTIEVKNGEIVSMTRSDGTSVDPADPSYGTYQTYATIDRVFLALQADYTAEADDIAVTYDATYGFPSNVSIDYIQDAMDDELSYQVSNFEVLE